MPAYDNKVLTGAGIAKLSQLIKEEIAQGGGGSGGTEYTAGSGISISDNAKIRLNYYPIGLNHVAELARGYTSHTWMVKNYSTKADVVAGLQRGEVVYSMANAYLSQYSLLGGGEDRAMLYYAQVTSDGIGFVTDLYNNDIFIFYKYLCLMDNILFVSSGITGEQFIETLIKDGIYYNSSTSGLRAKGIGSAIDELAATRVPSALVSTDTAPTTENAINWVYS